jgi:lipopolysaccharide/colanic/teichoic acid biosynthesis glycosyltransferase
MFSLSDLACLLLLRSNQGGWLLRRFIDIAICASGLAFLSPMLLLVALAIRVSSRGPVIYCQTRVGRGGRHFNLYKFRSMVVSADAVGPLVTAQGDARVTPIGRWLRRTKLDEFPQLFNVLRGDMTLVGPRPEVPK